LKLDATGKRGGERGRSLVVGPEAGIGDAEAGIGRQQRGDAQARNPRRIAGAHGHAVGDATVALARVGAHDADQQREALVVRHLLFGFPGAHIG
jgi:hypothetical protein